MSNIFNSTKMLNYFIFVLIFCALLMFTGEIFVFRSIDKLNGKIRYFAMVDEFLLNNQGPQIGTVIPNIEFSSPDNSKRIELLQNTNKTTLLFLNPNCPKCQDIINDLKEKEPIPGLIIINMDLNQEINSNQVVMPATERIKNIFMVHSVPYAIKLKNNIIIDKLSIGKTDQLIQFLEE